MNLPIPDSRSVSELVSLVPEVYQPIYGHPEVISQRPVQDGRFETILTTVREVSRLSERPLRILDLGCAQGYLSLALAVEGHNVVGVDLEETNIDLCEALRREKRLRNVTFLHRDLTDLSDVLNEGFDVALGLSVFHHLAHRDGYLSARNVADDISLHSQHGLYEFALPTEPLFWASSQPSEPRDWVSQYPFVLRIGESPTHLSEVKRPLFFASHSLALTSSGLKAWDNTSQFRPGSRSLEDVRRHYFFGDSVLKVVARFSETAALHDTEHYQNEARREAAFLTSGECEFTASLEVLGLRSLPDEVSLERTSVPGIALSECAGILTVPKRLSASKALLRQLAELESHGLYHGDIRPWNVLVEQVGDDATLIDFGAISDRPTDVVPHLNPMLAAVFTLVSTWFNGKLTHDGMPLLPGPRSHLAVPAPVLSAIDVLCSTNGLDQPFTLALEAFERSSVEASGVAISPAVEWVIELGRRNCVSDAKSRERENELHERENELHERENELHTLQSQFELLQGQHRSLSEADFEIQNLRHELDGVYGSRSWRMTRSFRSLTRAFRGTQ
jgi:O-antigen chain-terminating methyltransferase